MDRRLIAVLAVTAHLYCIVLADGPVYGGNPNPVNPAPAPAPAGNYLTQTVYGFLDFTTTIGNTVMVFSPQSAPPPEPPKTEKSVQENIIETKPPPPSVTSVKPEAIKPSKISDKDKTNKPAAPAVVSSAISVVSSPPKKDNKAPNAPKSVAKEQKQIITKVEVVAGPSKIVESSSPKQSTPKSNKNSSNKNKKNEGIKSVTNVVSSKVEVKQGPPASVISSKVQVKSSNDDEPAILITNNNIAEPEYDFLSRQPSEFVEETYKVINIRPSKSPGQKPKHVHKNRHQPTPPPDDDDDHPLGLVTTLGGTIVKDGLTTVHETSVIGTYISGKYAQVLNSNSKVLQSPSGHRGKISPSPTHRILKTVAPSIAKNHRHNLEPTPSVADDESNFGKTTRRQNNGGGSFKNRHRPQNNNNNNNNNNAENDNHNNTPASQGKKFKNRNASHQQRTQSTRFGRPVNSPQLATVSVFSETSTPSYSNRRKNNRNGHKTTVTPSSNNDSQSKRGFKPRVNPTPVEQVTPSASTSVYKFKLNRSPGSGRWQYKTSPKPKVTIRKINGEDEQQTTPNPNPLIEDTQYNDISPQARSDNDLELSGSQSGPGTLLENDADDNSIEKPPPVETLKVEISTPADFRDVYYEIATIRTPYTFQVGRVKNTRIITVTSTIEKRIEPTLVTNSQASLNEPLTENILATPSPYEKDHALLDSSIATLPAITLTSDMETPPLETVTETFSTTQNMLKTHILPVVRDVNMTSSLTFIQTYQVTRLVTATKTLPPMDFFQFIPSKTLKEFNSRLDEAGSELHLELDFGDSNEDEEGVPRRVFPPELDLASIGSDFDITEVDKYKLADNYLRLKKAQSKNHVTESPHPPTPALTPEQAQQLALLRLLNPAAAAQIPDVVTTSKPVLKLETIYESHVIPVFDGKTTTHSTISRPVATITKTEYEIGTSSLPALPLQTVNPLFPQQFSVTSTPVVVNTEVTATNSQVLKLTFGAKTVYTTLFTTKVVPTVLTSYVTSSVPVQPSVAPGFPGYFPSPFAPFPYVG
ncbi:uncharacterized protein LOC142974011 isoform X1 [Anticarsia gemmatalis]|uniref:uncharacterized protein LOC142974011 isoform X1 n=1 Tax=Anticarsia gemmatalis TaxID=129554 RepID=UPI003F75FE90